MTANTFPAFLSLLVLAAFSVVMGAWQASYAPTDEVHVVPRADLIDHPLTPDCECGPTCEPVPREDGTYWWLYTHHSLDGRELNE